jgi:hypothetical protein
MQKTYQHFKPIHVFKKSVNLLVEATYDDGSEGFASLTITDDKLCINQSDTPLNPTVDLDELKKLIAEYELLNAD